MSRDSVPLRDYVDALRATDQDALRVAKAEVDRRLEGMNELRDQINHERNSYLRVEDYERRHEALIAGRLSLETALAGRLQVLETWQANLSGRFVVIGALAGVGFGLIGALIAHLFGL